MTTSELERAQIEARTFKSAAKFHARRAPSDREVAAIRVAWDELQSYWDVMGQETSLDEEEMPSTLIPDVLTDLRAYLERLGERLG